MRRSIRLLPILLLTLPGAMPEATAGDAILRVGIPQSFFPDMSKALIGEVTDPFATVLTETSGLKSVPVIGGTASAVAKELHDDKLQLAVLHGFEFAWAKQKYADLAPLVVAVRAQKDFRACVLVRKDAGIATFADLKGKELSIPKRTVVAARMFLAKQCAKDDATPEQFFNKIVRADDVETSLDNLARGKFTAILVDSNGMDFYKDLKPGVFARFAIVAESQPFPPLILAYRQGALAEATLTRLRDGLNKAGATEMGRDTMQLWRIRAFGPVPSDLPQILADSLKRYPPPQTQE